MQGLEVVPLRCPRSLSRDLRFSLRTRSSKPRNIDDGGMWNSHSSPACKTVEKRHLPRLFRSSEPNPSWFPSHARPKTDPMTLDGSARLQRHLSDPRSDWVQSRELPQPCLRRVLRPQRRPRLRASSLHPASLAVLFRSASVHVAVTCVGVVEAVAKVHPRRWREKPRGCHQRSPRALSTRLAAKVVCPLRRTEGRFHIRARNGGEFTDRGRAPISTEFAHQK